jgi:GT2 family glycosyltransferase
VKEARTHEPDGQASERGKTRTVPIAVIIPTANARTVLNNVLEKIQHCDPQPAEILIHVDTAESDEAAVRAFPCGVRVITSATRQGPGGGRHKCLLACTTPYAASFDDDSYPVDRDYFGRLWQLFSENPRAAIFGATIWHRHEPPKARVATLVPRPSFVGCGCGVRVTAYQEVRGYLPRSIAYGLEESDLSLQLFAAGWEIYEVGDLRVFHDSDLDHHKSARVTSGVIANVGLYAFLHYPLIGWGRGLAQVASKVFYCIRKNRLRGIVSGILRIPVDCYHYRQYRKPLGWPVVKRYLQFCRANTA